MTEEPGKRLRALTDQYFDGVIERRHYLTERGVLLDRLAGLEPVGDLPVVGRAIALDESAAEGGSDAASRAGESKDESDDTQRLGPVRAEDGASLQDPAIATDSGDAAKRIDSRILIGVGFLAVLALGLTYLVWPGDEPVPTKTAGAAGGETGSANSQQATTGLEESFLEAEPTRLTGRQRVEQFLDQPLWTEEATAAFLFDWDLLSTNEREELRVAALFNHFTDEVRERIKVERALGSNAFANGLSLAESLSMELDMGLVDTQETAQAVTVEAPGAGAGAEAGIEPTSESSMQSASAERNPVVVPVEVTPPMPLESSAVGEPAANSDPVDRPRSGADQSQPAAANTVAVGEPVRGTTAESMLGTRIPSDRPCTAERLNFRSSTCWDMLTEERRGPVLRVVPAGRFQMGQAGEAAEGPVHEEIIEKPFAVGTFEITVEEFEFFCASTGARCPKRRWASEQYPAVDMSWQQAVAYTNWLTETTGAKYRLPTEAEWEYFARAGTTTLYPFGDEVSPTYARFDSGLGTLTPLPVDDRTTRYNGFRLWHISGNVREWTVDFWRADYDSAPDSTLRVVRGGSYAERSDRLRSAARASAAPDYFDANTGLRVVRELTGQELSEE